MVIYACVKIRIIDNEKASRLSADQHVVFRRLDRTLVYILYEETALKTNTIIINALQLDRLSHQMSDTIPGKFSRFGRHPTEEFVRFC